MYLRTINERENTSLRIRAFLPRFIFRLHALSECCIRNGTNLACISSTPFRCTFGFGSHSLSHTLLLHILETSNNIFTSHLPNTIPTRDEETHKKTICHDFLRIFYLFFGCVRMCANTFGCVNVSVGVCV